MFNLVLLLLLFQCKHPLSISVLIECSFSFYVVVRCNTSSMFSFISPDCFCLHIRNPLNRFFFIINISDEKKNDWLSIDIQRRIFTNRYLQTVKDVNETKKRFLYIWNANMYIYVSLHKKTEVCLGTMSFDILYISSSIQRIRGRERRSFLSIDFFRVTVYFLSNIIVNDVLTILYILLIIIYLYSMRTFGESVVDFMNEVYSKRSFGCYLSKQKVFYFVKNKNEKKTLCEVSVKRSNTLRYMILKGHACRFRLESDLTNNLFSHIFFDIQHDRVSACQRLHMLSLAQK